MRTAVAICALIAFASYAQVGLAGTIKDRHVRSANEFGDIIGDSGALLRDGKAIVFKEAGVTALAGPSAVLFSDGTSHQFAARKKRAIITPFGDNIGASGAVLRDGKQILFKEAGVTAVAGPSGVVFSDGQSHQFAARKKRAIISPFGDSIGASGAVLRDGTQILFKKPGMTAVAGPSAVLFSDGTSHQFSARKKRAINEFGDNVGKSGAVLRDGTQIQYKAPGVTALAGPSAVLFSDGQSHQFSARRKRAVNQYGDNIGESAAILRDGKVVLFQGAGVTALAGPSAVRFSDGQVHQFSSRRKRSVNEFGDIIGDSGALLRDGKSIVFKGHGVTALAGPSAVLFSDGQSHQFAARKKRAVNEFGDNFGEAGAVLRDGAQIQYKNPGVTALAGPSAVLFSDGQSHQFAARKKRSLNKFGDLIGDSGALLRDGKAVVFKGHGVKVASVADSGIVFTDGTSHQFAARKKRSVNEHGDIIGDSGALLADGTPIVFTEHGVTVVARGPSGVLFSNGQSVQFKN